jgi:hypothetical protein
MTNNETNEEEKKVVENVVWNDYHDNRSVARSVRCIQNNSEPIRSEYTVTYNLNGGYWTNESDNSDKQVIYID